MQHFGPVALLALLAVGWSFPLVLEIDRSIPGRGPGDNLTFLWNFWWMRHALANPDIQLFYTDHLFAPIGANLAQHTHTALPALVGATALGWLSVPVAHNVVVLATLFLNAVAAYALGFHVTSNKGGALVAASIFGGSPYVMAHLQGHLNLVSAWGLPIYALLLLRTLNNKSWRSAFATGVCLVAVAYTDYYYLLYAFAFSLLWVMTRWITLSVGWGNPSPRRLRFANAVLALLALDGLVAAVIVGTGGVATTVLGIRVSAQSIFNELTAGWILFLAWSWLRYAPRLAVGWRLASKPTQELRALAPAAALFTVGVSPLILQALRLWVGGDYVGQLFRWRSAPAGVDVVAPFLGNPYHPLWGDLVSGVYEFFDLNQVEGVAWVGVVPALLLWRVLRQTDADPTARPWFVTGTVLPSGRWVRFLPFSGGT